MPQDLTVFNIITQGGSFALLAFMVLYGLPKVFTEFRDQHIRNQQSLEAMEERHRQERMGDRCTVPQDILNIVMQSIRESGTCPMMTLQHAEPPSGTHKKPRAGGQ